jgi:hypothetical protein
LIAGSYSVTIKDANLCLATAVTNLAEPAAITISATATAPLCAPAQGVLPASEKGSITASSTGGLGTKMYSIDGGTNFQTSTSFTGVMPGTYTVTAKDGNSCMISTTSSVVVTSPAALTTTIASVDASGISTSDAAVCAGSSATFTATTTATSPTYLWSTLATTAPINVSTANTYSVTATDGAGKCWSNASKMLAVNVLPVVTVATVGATVGNPIRMCPSGGSFPLSFTTTGTAPFSYSLAPSTLNSMPSYTTTMGTITSTSTTSEVISVPTLLTPTGAANPYRFRLFVTDNNGCASASMSPVTNGELVAVRVNAYPYASFASTTPLSICNGMTTLTVNIDGTNGSFFGFGTESPRTVIYSINGISQAALTNITGTSVSIPVTQGGTYALVDVTDASSCQGFVSNATVTVYDARTTIMAQPSNQAVCAGSSVTFTSGAAVSATPPPGSTLKYDWQVNGGSTWTSIPGENATTYTFTAQLADNGKQYRMQAYYAASNGLPICSIASAISSNAVTLSVGAAITGANAGGPYTGAASVTLGASLGTGTTGTWSIVPANASIVFTPNVNTANAVVTGLPVGATTLRWTVTNGTGCIVSSDVTITRTVPKVNIFAVLEGALGTSAPLMDANLRTLPNAGTTYFSNVPSTVFAVPGTNGKAIVDYITVQVRSTLTTISDTRIGLIRRDGKIVEISDGETPLSFNVANGDYYIYVKHRNHLGFRSNGQYTLSTASTPQVNFTITPSLAKNGSNPGLKQIGIINCAYAGDGSGDDAIDISDFVQWFNNNGNSGPLLSDYNLDGDVNILDYVLWFNNNNKDAQY